MFLFLVVFSLLVNIVHSDQNSTLVISNSTTVGACDQVISDLINQLVVDNGSKKTIESCRKVSECYGAQKGEISQELKKIYDYRCEKYKLYSVGLIDCFQKILENRNSCPGYYDVTRYKPGGIKRNTINTGKSCIMQIVTKTCSTASHNFLKKNFPKFAIYLSKNLADDNCESVNVELYRRQCSVLQEEETYEWWILNDFVNSYKKLPMLINIEGVKRGIKLKNCYNTTCNIISIDEQMKHYEYYNAATSYFYNCVIRHGKVYPISIDPCKENDKECIKKSLISKCGDDILVKFDHFYDWFNKYDVMKPGKLEIQGDFSQYQVKDILRSSVSIDSSLGKCVPVAENLVTLLSRQTIGDPKRHYEIVNEVCAEIINCYGGTEAKKLKESYQKVCAKLDIAGNNKID